MRRALVLVAVLLTGFPARAAQCPTPARVVDVITELQAAERAFERRQSEGVSLAGDQARALLPCVTDPVTTGVAARFHRVEALRAFLDRDALAATLSFAAARSIEPGATLSTALAPPGHPLHALYENARAESVTVLPVPQPAQGELRLDGRLAGTRAADRPTIAQVLGGQGEVLLTAYVPAGKPLPAFLPPPPPPPDPAIVGAAEVPRRPTLLVAGVAGVVAAGALYVGGVVTHGTYERMPYEEQVDAQGLVRANHGLLVAAGVTGAAGAITSAIGVVTFNW